jgi:hypothetical protein
MTNIALEEKADAVLVYTLSFKNVEGYKDWKLPQDDVLLWEAVKKIPGKVKAVQEKR